MSLKKIGDKLGIAPKREKKSKKEKKKRKVRSTPIRC